MPLNKEWQAEQTRLTAALINAALDFTAFTSATATLVPVLGTMPTLYIAIGSAEDIAALISTKT